MNRDDILWKTVLEDTFDDFLRFFIPNTDDLFDLAKGVEYLDKELEQLFPPEGNAYKPRYVDKLAKVYTRQGTEEWILVHVEVQGYSDSQFAKRMFQYYSRIWDKYDRSVVAFAIFTDSEKGFHPDRFEQAFLGTTLSYTFNTYKILEQSEAVMAESDNPFAMVALTVKAALQGRQMADLELLHLKLELAKRLLSKNMAKDKIRKMMNFLRYYIRFDSQEMMDNFDKEITVLTKGDTTTMGTEEFLLDRAKKQGIEKGIEQGIEKGIEKNKKDIVRTLLSKKLTPEQIAEITEIPLAFVLSVKSELEKEL